MLSESPNPAALVAQTYYNSGMGMSLAAWIVLGLFAGFVASKMVNKTGEGFLLDVLLGIVGAVVGGWLFNVLGMPGVTGLNIWSLLVAIVGAIVALTIWHALRGNIRRPLP